MKCEICLNYFPYLQKHHIQSKSLGGTNKKLNISNICPNCHSKVHFGEIILEGKYLTLNGEKLIWHFKGEKSITGNEPHVFTY